MQVILLEKIRNLGNLGDKVNVKPGYGRNYLLPHGKAVAATAMNLVQFEQRRAELERKADEQLAEAKQRAEKLNQLKVTITALASDEGKLYGSVGANEITKAITVAGIEVEKREVSLPEGPIHTTGEFDIVVQVHSDVIAMVKVEVIAIK